MSRFQAQTNTLLDEELKDLEVVRIELSDAEVRRLAEILDGGFSLSPALQETLARLVDPDRRPPKLRWKETTT